MPSISTGEVFPTLCDSPGNRVQASRAGRLLETSIGELALRLGISPHDVLQQVISAGADEFWHEGSRFDSGARLRQYLDQPHRFDPAPELEVGLTADQLRQLAADWEMDAEALYAAFSSNAPADRSAKPGRKMAASGQHRSPTNEARRRKSG